MQQLPGHSPQPRARQFHRPQCNKTFCSQNFTAPDREPLLSAPCTSGLTCPRKADWGQVQGRAAHLARSPTAEKRQTHSARVSRGLVGLKGTGKGVGRARGGNRAHARAGSRACRRRDCGAGPCGLRERAVPRGEASGRSLAGPRLQPLPRAPLRLARPDPALVWPGALAPPARLQGTTRRARFQPRALSPRSAARRVPGGSPASGRPAPTHLRRRPFPGLWPAAASGAGPAAREPQARVPNRPVTKLEGFHANIHFLFLGEGFPISVFIFMRSGFSKFFTLSLYFYNQKDEHVTFPRNANRQPQHRCPPIRSTPEPLRHPEEVI